MDGNNEEIESGGNPTTKPTETPVESEERTAPMTDKPGDTDDSPGEKDISNVIAILNEFQKIAGGKGDITEIPENLIGVVKFTIEKMVAIRDSFKDPLFKQILDDMVDQKEDGKTPSVKVAIARCIPLEELQDIADNENYEDIQGAVDQRLEADRQSRDNEASLYGKYDESMNAGKAYCKEMKYDDAEMQELFSLAMQWFKILGDGNISKDDWARIDKMRNYDTDTKMLREQLPAEPVKEVLPDKSSVPIPNAPKPASAQRGPSNTIEAMNAAMPQEPSYIRPRAGVTGRRI